MRVYEFAAMPLDVREAIGRYSRGVPAEPVQVFPLQRTKLQAAVVLPAVLLVGSEIPTVVQTAASVRVSVESDAITMIGVMCAVAIAIGAFLGYYAGELVGRAIHPWRESLVVISPLVLHVRPTQVRVLQASAVARVEAITMRGMSMRFATDATVGVANEPAMRVEFASERDVERFGNAVQEAGQGMSVLGSALSGKLADATATKELRHAPPPAQRLARRLEGLSGCC